MGTPEAASWNPVTRVAFRLTFAYLVLFIFPFPLDIGAWFGLELPWYQGFWKVVTTWVGARFLGLEVIVQPTGSGDTAFNYVFVFCIALVAVVAAALWTLLDRRSRAYPRLFEGLRVYVRFNLATALIGYGTFKVIQSQFSPPSTDTLLQTYGQASPMGLLWTFMGFSYGYNLFTGAGEMLGGLLLATRRTTLFGSLVSIGVLSHVVVLNFCYDVPVKLYSIHLLLMAIFLACPDSGRLARMFFLNRAVAPAPQRTLFQSHRAQRLGGVAAAVYFVALTGLLLFGSYQQRAAYRNASAEIPLGGLWTVETFALDGEERPPLVTDRTRWWRLILEYPEWMRVQSTSGEFDSFRLGVDAVSKKLTLGKRDEPDWKAVLDYEEPSPGALTISGTLDGHALRATLVRSSTPEFPLMSRGFHWITEIPFNR